MKISLFMFLIVVVIYGISHEREKIETRKTRSFSSIKIDSFSRFI